jgi:hypothetical protein
LIPLMHVGLQGVLELIRFIKGFAGKPKAFRPVEIRKAAGTIEMTGTRRITLCGQLAVFAMSPLPVKNVLLRGEGVLTASLASLLRLYGKLCSGRRTGFHVIFAEKLQAVCYRGFANAARTCIRAGCNAVGPRGIELIDNPRSVPIIEPYLGNALQIYGTRHASYATRDAFEKASPRMHPRFRWMSAVVLARNQSSRLKWLVTRPGTAAFG